MPGSATSVGDSPLLPQAEGRAQRRPGSSRRARHVTRIKTSGAALRSARGLRRSDPRRACSGAATRRGFFASHSPNDAHRIIMRGRARSSNGTFSRQNLQQARYVEIMGLIPAWQRALKGNTAARIFVEFLASVRRPILGTDGWIPRQMSDRIEMLRKHGRTISAASARAASVDAVVVFHFDGGNIEYWVLADDRRIEIEAIRDAEEIWPVLVNGLLIEDAKSIPVSDADLKEELGARRVEHLVGIGIDE